MSDSTATLASAEKNTRMLALRHAQGQYLSPVLAAFASLTIYCMCVFFAEK